MAAVSLQHFDDLCLLAETHSREAQAKLREYRGERWAGWCADQMKSGGAGVFRWVRDGPRTRQSATADAAALGEPLPTGKDYLDSVDSHWWGYWGGSGGGLDFSSWAGEYDVGNAIGLDYDETKSDSDGGASLEGVPETALNGGSEPARAQGEGYEGGGDSGTDPEAADQNHRTRLRDPQVSPRRPVRGKRARDQSEVESGDSDARECDPG